MTSKPCFKCRETKPLSEFYRHKMMADGHLNKCKTCTKADTRKNREDKIELYRAYDRVRYYDHGHRAPPSKEARDRANKKWLNRNPVRRKARVLLGNAVRDKRVARESSCARCGRTTKLHAHHEDYTKPLDVVWICQTCHGKEHRKYKEAESRALRDLLRRD